MTLFYPKIRHFRKTGLYENQDTGRSTLSNSPKFLNGDFNNNGFYNNDIPVITPVISPNGSLPNGSVLNFKLKNENGEDGLNTKGVSKPKNNNVVIQSLHEKIKKYENLRNENYNWMTTLENEGKISKDDFDQFLDKIHHPSLAI